MAARKDTMNGHSSMPTAMTSMAALNGYERKVEEEPGGEPTDEVASSNGRQHQRRLRLRQSVVSGRGRRQHVYRHVGHDGETLRDGEQCEHLFMYSLFFF